MDIRIFLDKRGKIKKRVSEVRSVLFSEKYLYIFHAMFTYRHGTVEITLMTTMTAAEKYSYVTSLNTRHHLHVLLHELCSANRSI